MVFLFHSCMLKKPSGVTECVRTFNFYIKALALEWQQEMLSWPKASVKKDHEMNLKDEPGSVCPVSVT